MANRDIVAIGTSAGGLDALRFIASELPARFPAAVLAVMHLPPKIPSALDSILSQSGPLPAHFARDGEEALQGHLYLAPPDHHLLFDGKQLLLGTGARENFSRPSIDPLFRSLAQCCAHRSIAVLMTGTMGDGSSGLHALGDCGGRTVVQDPEDAAFPDMPANALRKGAVDHVATLAGIPNLLMNLVHQPAAVKRNPPEHLRHEVEMAKSGRSTIQVMDQIGNRSPLTCPECNGVLWEIEEGDGLRYRCHIGHAFTTELVNIALEDSVSRALAVALRSFEERGEIARNLERQALSRSQLASAKMWRQRISEINAQAETIRDAIKRINRLGNPMPSIAEESA
jgi:two-component system, chemotaxis family, protein-glutamate methylesterase/glutaminase